MINKESRKLVRGKRHLRVRKSVFGTTERPRLNVYRSLNQIYAQIIDDVKGVTLVAASTLEPEIKGNLASTKSVDAATAVGTAIAQKAMTKGIQKVVFDRGGNIYHGRVKALAEAARAAGLDF